MYVKQMSGYVARGAPENYYAFKSAPPPSVVPVTKANAPPPDAATLLEEKLQSSLEQIIHHSLSYLQLQAQAPPSMQAAWRTEMERISHTLSEQWAVSLSSVPVDQITPEQIMRTTVSLKQTSAAELSDAIRRHTEHFQVFQTLKQLESSGYDRYVFISEQAVTSCSVCTSHHGQIFTMPELEQQNIIPPLHPNCKCSLICVEPETLERFPDEGKLIDMLEEKPYNSDRGIYRYERNGDLLPVPIVTEPAPNWIVDTDPSWIGDLENWSSEFGQDAKAAWDAFYDAAQHRAVHMLDDAPGFLDWLTFGLVSGFWDGLYERNQRMLENPSPYNIANWLLVGIPDTLRGAVFPEKPFSFAHMMSLLETAALAYGAAKLTTKAPAAAAATVPGKTTLRHQASSGIKLESIPDKTTTIIGTYAKDTKSILKELDYPKSTDFGPKKGGFNLLNVPDELYKAVPTDQFWAKYNKPWLDAAIKRKDIITLASKPIERNLRFVNPDIGAKQLTGFGREFEYLQANGYHFDAGSMQMLPPQ